MNLIQKANHRMMYVLASCLSIIAYGVVNTASIVFIYAGETPEELLK